MSKKNEPGLRAWWGTLALSLASLALLLAAPLPAAAAIDCWMDAEHPSTGDQKPIADPTVAPTRQALQAVNAWLHAQPALHALPRTRLRSSWQVGGQWTEPARGGRLLLRDHRESMWVPGRCDVIAGADRLGPHASVVVAVNVPTAFFVSETAELGDEQFQAWRERPLIGRVNGQPLYAGNMLVITRGGRLPWAPVSTADYIDFTLRDLQRRLDEDRATRARLSPEMQQALREQEAAHARRRPGVDLQPLVTMMRRVEAWRAGLTPPQLAAQARLGLNGLHDDAVPVDRYPLLARPDPQFPWDRQHPARAQMLKVELAGGGDFEAPMQQVLQQLDMRPLQALVD